MEKGELKIQPLLLRGLREGSGYSVEDAAKKIRVSPDKIAEVEAGNSHFTVTQIVKLAEIYKRPLAAFFSDEPPSLPVLPDHRINRDKKITPQVLLAERRANYLAIKLAELSNKKSDIPEFSEALTAEELAKQFKEYLGFEEKKPQKSENLLSQFKEIIEDKLLIVIIEYPLKADDVRGFSILSEVAVIVLNEKDQNSVKLFSLFHEICHLIKRASGICSIETDLGDKTQIETYCDAFAAEFLVPKIDFDAEVKRWGVDKDGVQKISDRFGVSRQVIMLRLLRLGYIDSTRYTNFKRNFEKARVDSTPGFRRRNWEKVYSHRAGKFAIKEVSNAYKRGDITLFESSKILNLKVKYTEKFIG